MKLRAVWKKERERDTSKMTESTDLQRPLLKFITCGSVDDGKSTLIGNILYNSKLLYKDQVEALKTESLNGSCDGELDYSLLLDGLLAEREQGITIDVAYRYFSTRKRSFIVADTPGHEEYTRNMAVGASYADLAIILIDASKGVLVQTRRHARICALMGIRHFVFAVNKMDLVGFNEDRFNTITEELAKLGNELSFQEYTAIPLSARAGDNVIVSSGRTPWYQGKALLEYLEDVDTSKDSSEKGFLMPIQRVCRPNQFFRGFQGGGERARVKQICSGFNDISRAFSGMPVTVCLDREVDVSRGSVFAAGDDSDTVKAAREVLGTVLWTDDEQFSFSKDYLMKIGTAMISVRIKTLEYAVNVNTGEHVTAEVLSKNEIAVCRISFIDSVAVSEFRNHRALGEFILIDRVTNMTAACGVINAIDSAENHEYSSMEARRHMLRQKPGVFVFHSGKGAENRERQIKLAGDAERKLLGLGRLSYFCRNPDTKTFQNTVRALAESGIIVLAVADMPESILGWQEISPEQEESGIDAIVKFIVELTADENT